MPASEACCRCPGRPCIALWAPNEPRVVPQVQAPVARHGPRIAAGPLSITVGGTRAAVEAIARLGTEADRTDCERQQPSELC